jgi:hypothetical protein
MRRQKHQDLIEYKYLDRSDTKYVHTQVELVTIYQQRIVNVPDNVIPVHNYAIYHLQKCSIFLERHRTQSMQKLSTYWVK